MKVSVDLDIRQFSLPKEGNDAEENEDAIAFDEESGIMKIGLADGASESGFAGQWARKLTEAFVTDTPNISEPAADWFESWLEVPQEKWREEVPWDRLPWHGERKVAFIGFKKGVRRV